MQKILHGLDCFNGTIVRIVKFIVSVCIAVQILIIFAGVIWRYFLNAPLSWVDEVAALLLVMIAFMGCYVALASRKLARIELFIPSPYVPESKNAGTLYSALHFLWFDSGDV